MHYTEDLLDAAIRLRFPGIIEREFQEVHYNVKAYNFITRWGLIPAIVILGAFWAGDFFGFTQNLHIIAAIRVLSMTPLVLMYLFRKTAFMRKHIRDVSSVYLFFLACTVLSIIAITPHTDFAHRGYTLSFPMVIFIIFLAKPKMWVGVACALGFSFVFAVVNIVAHVMPLGLDDLVSHIHVNLVMLSSVVIGGVTCYVLEVAERREFIQKKIIEQDREQMMLQKLELADVVEQVRQANEKLEENNEHLNQLNREKNEFLGIAAHDLKNPLTGIAVNVANVKRYNSRMSAQDVSDVMETVERATIRMRDIVVNLLNVNAIESGKLQCTPAPINVEDIVRNVLVEYRERAIAKAIRLHIVNECSQSAQAYADASIVHQVIDNLLSNAMKFSPMHRNVHIRLQEHRQAAVVRIAIEDEGPGISPEDMQKLFGKFQRLSAKPTAGEHSTGLGLSIVKKIVEMMQGNVWCESQLGKGSRFIVELPAVGQSVAETQPKLETLAPFTA